MHATANDLQTRPQSILDALDRGDEVILELQGKQIKMTPLFSDVVENEDNGFIGMWNDRKDMEDPTAYIRQLRKGRFA
ncbi:MAG: hypothetical protein HQM12_06520 [SAR324 cluster bacterium]|nr:hypothetical protein [SAR324 cluster bacterium]